MAPAPSASAFPLHPNSCLLDEHDRMLFQHSHPTGTDAERTTLQEGVEGFSAAISKAIQPQSHALHLDQRAGTLPTHHRSNERVPGSSSQATKAAEDQPKYYKELTVRCTSAFWQAPGTTTEEMKQINTTVYRLPGAGFAEKDGTFVNSARWLQWKSVALPPPGTCRLDQDILAQIFLRVRELYKKESGKFPDPIVNVSWTYTIPTSPSLAEVAKEINGKALADISDEKTNLSLKAGQQLPGFAALRDDGSTSSGNWLYCGSWTEAGAMMQRRGTEDPSGQGIYPNWGWSWPANRRVLYNRASCDLAGKPWDPTRSQVWWNETAQKWVGNDVPDFKPDSKPEEHMGPFIMNPEGVGRIFVPLGAMADGPFPEFYEPIESPIENPLHPNQSSNPVVKKFKTAMDKYGTVKEGYNIICTTYLLTEHYHYWTKNNPMNVELVPEPFVEIPAELADQMGIRG